MASVRTIVLATAAVTAAPITTHAQDAAVSVGAAASPTDATATGDAAARPPEPLPTADKPAASAAPVGTVSAADIKPIRRWAPERNMVELGVFGGIFVANKQHDLYNPATTPGEQIKRPAADIGARLGFYPLRFLGVEAEFAAIPAKYAAGVGANAPGGSGFIYGVRGHAILQFPTYRVVPFILGGYGALGVSSAANVAGKDTDGVGHFGGGLKYYFNRWLGIRLDVRGLIAAKAMKEVGAAPHLETTLGLILTLNRKKPKPAPDPDRDRDGFLNENDKCPDDKGVAPDGCPDKDSDGDTFMDSVDKCVDVPGVAPDGCPPGDRDEDGFTDDIDKCPDEKGIAPDGCPIRDKDGDGIPDDVDKCVSEPETVNNYQDSDGCPDELPKEVKQFHGVIEGIFFDFNKDTIKKTSTKTLDAAAKVFQEFPDIKVEIVGHADEVGSDDYNVSLSQRRADSVKAWLVKKGVSADRIDSRGVGAAEPIDTTGTEAGRAKNRRIEFKIRQ